ncbi:GSU2403 family nucleotidyltransferase fold protein [uncultured Rhodoferax sp.]|uniref:GSU2403 family nucleotidyltransferase fold protein n=1 Tax=uncultured Rhodoferax sp. TaxID=223188 RepID=UPI0025EE3C69|nr:GSU2403 family nucleotidyltransferase fold protein [uncultured Rhodoferax sp.]
MPESTFFLDQSESQKRQYIDAETVFLALAKAKKAAAEVRGSMLWRELRGKRTLIRTSASGAQKSLGPHGDDTQAMYDSFVARKSAAEARLKALKTQLATQQRLNRALRVGRVPNVVVGVINALESIGVQEHFLVVGTHALYAYESAAGVRITEEAMATRDVDMLFDTRKHISFFTTMKKLDSSLIGVLRKVDPSFEVVEDQLYTARNQDGFEVDIIRRAAKDADPHPLRMSDEDDDFWAVQVSMGERLQSARRVDQMVVATSGEMALMRTIHPLDFARIKLGLSRQLGRDPNKSGRDALQSLIVTELVEEYLPHFLLAAPEAGNT